jgi:hypothetical protein
MGYNFRLLREARNDGVIITFRGGGGWMAATPPSNPLPLSTIW